MLFLLLCTACDSGARGRPNFLGLGRLGGGWETGKAEGVWTGLEEKARGRALGR